MAPIKRLIGQLGFLRLGGTPVPADEDTRVMRLFQNRAELKKAYGSLQDEVQRLRDRVKQQEGATARVQEVLEELEGHLAQPETGYPALVFYQLRDFWTGGRTLLSQFAGELAAQQEERERKLLIADFNRRQFGQLQQAEAAVRQADFAYNDTRSRLANLELQLTQLQRFWHFFRRRTVRQRLQSVHVESLLRSQDLQGAQQIHEQLRATAPPEFKGLSVDARRAINLAVIAYAQVLCARLADTPLVQMAQEASERRTPVAGSYGSRSSCERLMGQIRQGRVQLGEREQLTAQIRETVERLRAQVRYRDSADTVPQADTIALGGQGPAAGAVLASDCWEIYRVLLR